MQVVLLKQMWDNSRSDGWPVRMPQYGGDHSLALDQSQSR